MIFLRIPQSLRNWADEKILKYQAFILYSEQKLYIHLVETIYKKVKSKTL